MTEFKNYLEREIDALGGGQSGASGLPDFSAAADGDVLKVVGGGATLAGFEIAADLSAATADGGTWTITFDGDETDPIAWNASGEDITAAMEALASVGVGNVEVGNDLANGAGMFFIGDLANQPIAEELLTADGAELTGPDSPYTLPVTVSQEGDPGVPNTTAWAPA